jgi:hypothetical protein
MLGKAIGDDLSLAQKSDKPIDGTICISTRPGNYLQGSLVDEKVFEVKSDVI